MKIKCIIKSILFSFLILPLSQSYGQTPNNEMNPSLSFPYIESYPVLVEARGTYLRTAFVDDDRTDNDDVTFKFDKFRNIIAIYRPLPATSFSLTGNESFKTGNIIDLNATGEYNYPIQYENGGSSSNDSMLGVFVDSNGNYLSPGSESYENIGVITLPTAAGRLPTDITEDFVIPSNSEECVKLQIPDNANRILFSTNDSFFSDNGDRDDNFKAHIHVLHKGASVGYANPVQVIEAPQLERDTNNLTHHYQSSYDLVADKPFMVRAGIHKLYQDMDLPNNTGALFTPVLKIEKEVNGVYVDIKNIEDLKNVSYTCKGKNNTESKNNCMFEGDDFKVFNTPETEQDGTKYYGAINKQFRLKDGLPKGSYKITVSLDFGSDVPCERFKSEGFKKAEKLSEYFELEVHEIKSPRIGLARANCEDISSDCTVNENAMYNFINNNKEIDWFNRFFPVREDDKKFFRAEYHTRNVPIPQSLLTYEDTIRLALNTTLLTRHKLLSHYEYLVGIGSETFFTDKSQGLSASKTTAGLAFTNLPSPFNRVAFIRSEELNTGTLLHELGHLFGQYKEFYGFTDDNGNYLPDDQQYLCTAHDLKIRNNMGGFDTTPMPCYKFKGYTSYDFKNRQYVSKPYSIMGDSEDLNEQSMDRDTYISVFNHLKNPARDPKITLISGIYAKGKMFNTQVNNHGAGMLHPLSDEGDLHIMLKDSSDQMLVETKVSSSFEYEVLKAEGGEHVSVSDLAPIIVAFPYQEKAVKAVIMKGEDMIFSKDLPVDNNPQHLFSSHNTHSTVRNFPMLEHSHKVELIKRKAVKATSSSFTKFMYSPAFEMEFSYNACSESLESEDGIAILLGKDPAHYTANKLKPRNQGVNFHNNNKGLSLHLNMNKRIQIKDGAGNTLDSRKYKVEMGCNDWKTLKLTIDESNKLTLKEKNKILISHDLTLSQIEEISSQPIGFNAYSEEKGQYGVRNVKITALPLE